MNKGAFVFRNDGNGCLSSKFMHDKSGPFAESSKRINNKPYDPVDPFIASYITVWSDGSNSTGEAELEIKKQTYNTDLYELTWHDIGTPTNIKFKGIAMIYDQLLVGTYWQP